jgi:hypothetical protein
MRTPRTARLWRIASPMGRSEGPRRGRDSRAAPTLRITWAISACTGGAKRSTQAGSTPASAATSSMVRPARSRAWTSRTGNVLSRRASAAAWASSSAARSAASCASSRTAAATSSSTWRT